MGQNLTVTALVLLAAPAGEYDKRVVLLTKERGKITVFARGARRQNSPFLAAVNPFAFGRFEIFEGRNSYTLVKADIDNYFGEITSDLGNTYYGMYFLEVADYFAQENADEKRMLLLLYQSLRALAKDSLPNRLVRRIFELKVLVINGEYPNVFSCQRCGREDNIEYFSSESRGVLCKDCRREFTIAIDNSTLYTLQYIISAPLEKLYTFVVKDEVLVKLEAIMQEYFLLHVEKSFKTIPFLEDLY